MMVWVIRQTVGSRGLANRQRVQNSDVDQGGEGPINSGEVDDSAAVAEPIDDLLGGQVPGRRLAQQHRHHREPRPRASKAVLAKDRSSVLDAVSSAHRVLVDGDSEGVTALRYYLRMNADSQQSEPRLPDDQTAFIVEVFRMLADATRIQILWALSDGELSVNELAEHVAKPASSVSQHLAKLRMARLVRTRRAGTQVIYRLENDHVRQLVTDAVFNAEHAGPGVPDHHRSDARLRQLESPLSPGGTAASGRVAGSHD
ncbi:MAG: hypothetical protein QOH57_4026 [Mycobacterium sp.]|nr:hypothetical protein [Mycobacterium sp.]